jgi:radical SAM/Cys-rich protein
MNLFSELLQTHELELTRQESEILQINVGKLCNLTCIHCHVNAGPKRKEIITKETLDHILGWFRDSGIGTVDLTGGTPEMIPDFRYFIEKLREIRPSVRIMTRCNMTILNEPGYDWVIPFYQKHRIEVIASMPCYEPKNVNEQRGDGVFDRSIEALRMLNQAGYGVSDSGLLLHLVYNPNGAFLPPEQKELELDYKEALLDNFGIVFNDLYALANLPVSRFASYLKRNGEYEEYMELLKDAFNPLTIPGLMCRNTISVSWEGDVFDCDFNQMLNLPMGDKKRGIKLWELEHHTLEGHSIRTANHCLGCTAGSGSSCGGALA